MTHQYMEIKLKELEKRIRALEQEQKTAHWILVHPLQEDDCGSYMCDCCKWGHPKLDGTEKFCPNCGVRMVDQQEREDAK